MNGYILVGIIGILAIVFFTTMAYSPDPNDFLIPGAISVCSLIITICTIHMIQELTALRRNK